MELWYTQEHSPNVRLSIKVDRHIYSEQSRFQRIDVMESYEFGTFLTLDSQMMVAEKDECIYHDMMVHVPMATHPAIQKVLVIGGGDGGAVRELTRYKSITHIDVVEIDKRVVEVCRHYLPQTASKLDDARVHLYYEDGLRFVRDKEQAYDLILVDSTDPFGPGEGLFTKEFYGNCHKALKEDGILINQHESPYYERNKGSLQKTYERVSAFFPITKFYGACIPTYSSGYWLFGFASKKYDPVRDLKKDQWEALELDTQYYNTAIHKGSFALPNMIKKLFDK
ncbi:spermidine synthase [Sporanaerobium hydrogeniformans]|uniref:Spermidine synthase n=1 Tax=Sporanaerobium hydrogeniformans TaxID=3072179 RepID=A0AC61DG24_9FIRM|nr:polyamine aminopropyltransferase [Sporanaerobium hydrogeniformans]PHV72239.1 spermidine synthase [Sporanaerobium hydrogeniformans]